MNDAHIGEDQVTDPSSEVIYYELEPDFPPIQDAAASFAPTSPAALKRMAQSTAAARPCAKGKTRGAAQAAAGAKKTKPCNSKKGQREQVCMNQESLTN